MVRYTRISALLLISALLCNGIQALATVKCKPHTENKMKTLFNKLVTVGNTYGWKEFSHQASEAFAQDAICKDMAEVFKSLENSQNPIWVGVKLNAYLNRLPKEIDATIKALGVLKLKSIIEEKMAIKKPASTHHHRHDEL